MTDITKCQGFDCPLRNKCYRYLAVAEGLYQAWLVENPYIDKIGCQYFWEVRDKTDGNRQKR